MIKPGTNVALPVYLTASNTYPAFIINEQGEIITANTLFIQVCNVNPQSNVFAQDVFTDNSFKGIVYKVTGVNAATPITIKSALPNCDIQWEIAVFEDSYFICTGILTQQKSEFLYCQNSFSVFFDNSPALMWATDKDGRIQMMNKRYKDHTGFTDAHLGRSLWDVYPKEMADQFKTNDDIVLKTNELLEIEEVSIDKTGVKRNYLAYKFPLVTARNGAMVAGCSIDITDILEKTRQLVVQSHLLDSIEEAVYLLDENTKVIYWNKYAEKIFGWPKDEILQKDIRVLMPQGKLDEAVEQALQARQGWHGEIDIVKKDGTMVQVHTTKSPVFDKDNNITAYIGISKDITERKFVHKQLVKQNNQFRQIARLQSHAVRRPLANILGLIDLVQYYADKNEMQEVLYMIGLLKQSSEDLDDIIRRIVLKAGVYFDPKLRIA